VVRAQAARRVNPNTLWLREWKERCRQASLLATTKTRPFATNSLGSAPLASGRAARAEATTELASRTKASALAASEAGRTARRGVAQVRNAKALNDLGITLCDTRCLTFEMRGAFRLAGKRPLD